MTAGIDGGDLGIWQVVVPTGTTDLNSVTNPSFETNTTGWTTTNATLTRTAGAGAFGAYGGRMLASATNGKAGFTCASVASGTHGVASAYIKADSASVQLKVTIGASSAIISHPGDGARHRLEVPLAAPSTTTPVVEIIDGRSSAWTNVDIDGVMFETGRDLATTYIDGDQDGCLWTGTPHGSTSSRDGRDGRGGVLTSFTSLGLMPLMTQQGLGLPPANVSTQPYAINDGAVYSRTTFGMRTLQIPCELIYASGLISELHAQRAAVLAALNTNARAGRGPIKLRYTGAAVPKTVLAYYDAGLEQQPAEATVETLPLRFLTDPDWQSETEAQATLATVQSVTGCNMVALRDPTGAWSNMGGGSASATPLAVYDAIRLPDGRIVLGGSFQDMGGVTAADYFALWNGSSWSAFGSAVNNPVYAFALDASGDILYFGGDFTTVGGVTYNRIGQYQISTATFSRGVGPTFGVNSTVNDMVWDSANNVLWLVGTFTSAGGSARNGVTWYSGGAFDSPAGVTASTGITNLKCCAIGPDGAFYAAGDNGIVRWSGTAWVNIGATNSNVGQLLTYGGRLYASGGFTTIGGVAANRIASWNGVSWAPVGSGAAAGVIYKLAAGAGGQLHAAGGFWGTIGGITPPDSIATWNGSSWLPFSANPPDTGAHANDNYQVWTFDDGSVLLTWFAAVGTFGTTVTVPGMTTVNNPGSANAYPLISLSAVGALYSIENLTTGQAIRCNGLSLASGETAILDLRPGRKTFKATFRDLQPFVLGGSDLSGFALAPGANTIAVYASAGSGAIRWTTRYQSAD
jgi:hypothetical protein